MPLSKNTSNHISLLIVISNAKARKERWRPRSTNQYVSQFLSLASSPTICTCANATPASIRYHLSHPLTPRPLHFSRNRFLRHWTIHRAWMLFLRKRRAAEERELERQYMSMRAACEHLRLLDAHGNRVSEEEAGGQGPDAGRLGVKGREVGRLYRSAMIKRGVWGSVPVEYARLQTDFPGREGWNHGWTRN
jgi:large subunit ribosomal protein L40